MIKGKLLHQDVGSNNFMKPSTGARILFIAPVQKAISKTASQSVVQLLEPVIFILGIIQGHILLPSRGGIGKRLTTARITLI